MTKPYVVVVSGCPGSGKTTLAVAVAERLHLPHLSRDAIKEGMAATVGATTLEAGRALGPPAFARYFELLEAYVVGGVSLTTEAHFQVGRSEPELLRALAGADAVWIHCQAPPGIIAGRVRRRMQAGPRAACHLPQDRLVVAAMEAGRYGWSDYEDLDLPFPKLTVDTADGLAPALEDIVRWIRGTTRRA